MSASNPSVSIICTTSRPQFLDRLYAQAVKQKYEGEMEFILSTKWECPSLHIPIILKDWAGSSVTFYQGDSETIGAGRNTAIRNASGEICLVFDDDDWQSPHRVERQVRHLQLSGKAVVGTFEPTSYREGDEYAWRCMDRMDHSAGGLLAFRRDWALAHPFGEAPSPFPEDNVFVKEAIKHEQFSNIGGLELGVLSNHPLNDSKRDSMMGQVEIMFELSRGRGEFNYARIPYAQIKHIVEG